MTPVTKSSWCSDTPDASDDPDASDAPGAPVEPDKIADIGTSPQGRRVGFMKQKSEDRPLDRPAWTCRDPPSKIPSKIPPPATVSFVQLGHVKIRRPRFRPRFPRPAGIPQGGRQGELFSLGSSRSPLSQLPSRPFVVFLTLISLHFHFSQAVLSFFNQSLPVSHSIFIPARQS